MSETILYRTEGPIAEITLNRPEKLNSIDTAMIGGLHKALDAAEADSKVRAIVLRGAGRAFSSGFDLGEMDPEASIADLRKALHADFNIIMRFWHSPKPTVSAVHGYVLGGGFELAMACDVTIAADDAVFGEPELKFGSGIVAMILPWITGPKQAKEMLLFGNDRVSAGRAYDIGLINSLVTRDDLFRESRTFAMRSAKLDSSAVRLTKQAINRSYSHMGLEGALDQALDLDLEIETTDTEESRTFKSILREQGVKAAVAWRESKFHVINAQTAG